MRPFIFSVGRISFDLDVHMTSLVLHLADFESVPDCDDEGNGCRDGLVEDGSRTCAEYKGSDEQPDGCKRAYPAR